MAIYESLEPLKSINKLNVNWISLCMLEQVNLAFVWLGWVNEYCIATGDSNLYENWKD